MKRPDEIKGKSRARNHRRPCLMAYTINNTQPVICTIIADQPYFYMEEEHVEPEDDILGFEEYADFEKDMADLKRKMSAYDRLSKSFEQNAESRLSVFTENAKNMMEERPKNTELLQPAGKIISILSQSRMAKSLLDFAHSNGVHITESSQVDSARYDRDSRKILIHPDLAEAQAVLLAVRELRRHWQHRKGVMIHPLTFLPEQAILINRAQIADLSVAMVRMGWELQLAGYRNAWEEIENSGMADLGRAFAREAFVDFRSLESGKASSAVFETWFLSERCRHQDKKLIQAMLADHQGYVFLNEDASRHVSIELIITLGTQPFGKNYLAPYAQMIIEDPVFNEVRDRSNANFLWFIKFERSFRETECALQSEEGINEGDVLSRSPFIKTGEQEHGHESIIIPISQSPRFIHRGERGLQGGKLEDDGLRTNVIHVMFSQAEHR